MAGRRGWLVLVSEMAGNTLMCRELDPGLRRVLERLSGSYRRVETVGMRNDVPNIEITIEWRRLGPVHE